MSQATAATAPVIKGREEKRPRPLNAEQATAITVDFLRRLGNKIDEPSNCLHQLD